MTTRKTTLHAQAGRVLTALAVIGAAAAGAQTYQSTVLSDQPLVYFPLGDLPPAGGQALNRAIGSTVGNGEHINVVPGAPGAIAGSTNPAASYTGARTVVPWSAALNPPATASFTVEAWVKPTAEGLSNAQSPLFCRKSAGNRQGWVFFQRTSDVGFNFRMYNENGSSTSVDITGGPYIVGEWTHLAATWNGTTRTAVLYVNGVQAAASAAGAGYVPNDSIPFSVGAYGADAPGDNSFTGDIDEVAFYPAALTAAQIAEHRTTALDPAPVVPYQQLVASQNPVLYLRMDEKEPSRAPAINRGTLGSDAEGVHFPGATHQVPGALAGSTDTAMGYRLIDKNSSDGDYPTVLPFRPELNTATFSIEAWVKPLKDGNGNAQCPLYNYRGGSVSRSGWVFYQRAAGTGWNFRSYNGVGTTLAIDITGGPYTVGQWQHIVATFDSTTQTAVLYVNGVPVGTKTVASGLYVPNASDILPSIGGFSNGWENGFEGDIDEVAFYQTALSPTVVQQHYQNGTNASRATPYEALVAASSPVVYLKLNEPAVAQVQNLGTLGATAVGTYVNAPMSFPGPAMPEFPGFGVVGVSSLFNGNNTYVELRNPAELNLAGPLTLEAWIQPSDLQVNASSGIITHGANNDFSSEVFLRIEGGNYEVGGKTGKASVAVPGGDLGTTSWIHLAGTWESGNWNLYRNGVLIATGEDATGPTAVNNANWAVGARGRWKNVNGYPAGPVADQRVFTGAIASPAIYSGALSPERIKAHFAAGLGIIAPVVTRTNGTTSVTWTGGTLQESTDLNTWTDLPGAVSPYVPESGARRYFRVRY